MLIVPERWKYFLIVSVLSSPIHGVYLFLGNCPLVLEETCDSNLVHFTLHMSFHEELYQYKLNPFQPQLPREFNTLVPLKILIHGYGGLENDVAISNVSKAYQDLRHNVITVDWGVLAAQPCYVTAALNTWHVAQCLTLLIVRLIPLGVDPYFVHMVGFSLGAHIAGFTGQNLQKEIGYSVHRITGLDPALPFFATLKDESKLDSGDAFFVDVVHTSAGIYGKIETLGHADFYMNGGTLQPSCKNSSNPVLCSHTMAGVYFAETVGNPEAYLGFKCDNLFNYVLGQCQPEETTAFMGEYANVGTRGTYFVNTS